MSVVPYTGGGRNIGSYRRQFPSRGLANFVRRAIRHYGPSLTERVKNAAMGYAAEKFSDWRKKGIKRKMASSSKVGPATRPRTVRYHTLGGAGKKFSKKGSTSALSLFLKKGFNMKVESGSSITDVEACYVGHTALPINRVVPCVFYALARKILNGQKCFPTDGLEPTGMQAVTIYWRYRTTLNGVVATTAGGAVGANIDIVGLGNAMGQELLTVISATVTYFEAVKVEIYATTSGELLFEANCDAIKVEVDSVSNLQIQNRTQATGAGDESSALDVSNNPLRGKMYNGHGNIHPYRFNNDTAVTCPTLNYDNNTGLLQVAAGDANLTTQMAQAMKKPPPRSAFGNVQSTKYVQIAPGEIRRSKVRGKFTMNFNNFIKAYLDTMRGAAFIFSLNHTYVPKGPSAFFGLEKLCDSGGETSSIAIGFEATHSVNAMVTISNKNFVNPYVLF